MKQLFRKIRIYFLKVIFKLKKKINSTHLFFYSEGQNNVFDDFEETKRSPYFNGKEYTEMMEFKNSWSNWSDAKLLGVGTYENISYEKE